MTDPTSKKANAFLQTENRDLKSILSKVKQLIELNTAVAGFMDDNLKDYCQVANLIDSRLILVAVNASIATQIRFQSTDLIRQFKSHPLLRSIQSIHCKVSPTISTQSSPRRAQPPERMSPLSSATAAVVRETAQAIDDVKLREALERIAGHCK